MQTFRPIIWIFTEGVGDGIKSKKSFLLYIDSNLGIFQYFYIAAIEVGSLGKAKLKSQKKFSTSSVSQDFFQKFHLFFLVLCRVSCEIKAVWIVK